MGILTGKWKYRDMLLLQTIQLVSYIAFASFRVLKDQGILDKDLDQSVKQEIIYTRLKNALTRKVGEGALFAFEIRYDPTVWRAKPFLLCEVMLQPDASPGYWQLKFDFSQPVNEGVQILNGNSGDWLPVDVTQMALEMVNDRDNG